jgi:hypothetical protein
LLSLFALQYICSFRRKEGSAVDIPFQLRRGEGGCIMLQIRRLTDRHAAFDREKQD